MQEVKEEACVDVQIEDLEFLHVDYMRDEYTNFYFRAKKWEGEPKLGEPHLASEALWIEWEAIPDDIILQVRNFLEQSKAGSHFSEMVRHRC